ncbi:MAG: PD-(D/E)XK nuclease family protein [Rhodospirillaceae bacterium]
MRIVFDPDFDHGSWPGPLRGGRASAGEDWVGPSGLVGVLETALGIGGPWLTMQERAARMVPAVSRMEGFWARSAEVDPFAAARRLLQWRDTLVMGGWAGTARGPRLAALASLPAADVPGLPDRLRAVQRALERRAAPIGPLELLTPRADLEWLWQRTLDLLERRGTRVTEAEIAAAPAPEGSDLAVARAGRFKPSGDGTLILLRPAGPLAAAEEAAAWTASQGRTAGTLIVGSDPALDTALHRHGLPTAGASHAMRDGVPLQVLPLVLELGWSPQDPQRAYELLSMRASPVPAEVRWRLRRALGEWPAVDSDTWREKLAEGLAAIDDPARRERVKKRLDIVWAAPVLRSDRYPVSEVGRRARMLVQWFNARAVTADDEAPAWHAAVAQCQTLLDMIQHAGLTSLSAPQLRHLVAEATQGAGGDRPFPPEAGLSHVGAPGSVAGAVPLIVWWRFDDVSAGGIPRLPLTRAERDELESLGVVLQDPGRAAAIQARRWRRPLEQASERLLLVCPGKDIDGEDLHPHPLWDELVARVDEKNTRRVAERTLMRASLAGLVPQQRREALPPLAPRRVWAVPAGRIARRETESPSSVEMLFGCPFQWALKYAAKLEAADSAQVEEAASPRLLGSLLHHVMNRLFAGPPLGAAEAAAEAGAVFDREGPRLVAALFLPGAESQREHVRRVAAATARALFDMMQARKLRVIDTEVTRTGQAFGAAFIGRVDLVLGGPSGGVGSRRIVDLKWGGAGRKQQALEAGAAVQLASYAYLEAEGRAPFPAVGYYVMDGQRLLTTQPDAFQAAEAVEGPTPEETWRRVEATHAREWSDLDQGTLTARGVETETAKVLKEPQAEGDLLRIPPACHYCDYGALCGLVVKEGA